MIILQLLLYCLLLTVMVKLFVIGGPILDIVEIQIGHLIHNVLLLANAFLHIRAILGIGLF